MLLFFQHPPHTWFCLCRGRCKNTSQHICI